MKFKEIVNIDQIPKVDQITDVPLEETSKVYDVCLQMEALCDITNGIGLSAVQVGIPWKLFVVKSDGKNPLIPKGRYGYFANCDYEEVTDTERIVSVEGCLSIRSEDGQLRFFQVERSQKIRIYGYKFNTNDFEKFDCELDPYEQGVVFQHEIDHQKGTLISDIGKEIFIWNSP
jgi:peptide deformylase